ncbi:MAG: undecaprenyl-diphosphate phosphatase [Gammaproteobacteria bacterium]|nr:undecaprenyl-diphosphate phosphatase [Gammaproteobacteria bacterium]
MDLIQIIVLALVQGLSEFLPISSSAHLILVPKLANWPDQGLAFDVATHVGTLTAVVFYFRHELRRMSLAWFQHVGGGQASRDSQLAWAVLWATIPVGLSGLIFKDIVEQDLRSAMVIAITTLLFGVLLGWSDRKGGGSRSEYELTWKDILTIGCAQAIALIPGTSRSGITMTAGLAMGLSRSAAARFSFLMSIPVIVLAGGLETLSLLKQGASVDWTAILLGTVLSALSAYACIHFFLKLLERIGMMPFVIYRMILGAALLVWVV